MLWRSLENRQSCEGDLITEVAKGSISAGFGWRRASSGLVRMENSEPSQGVEPLLVCLVPWGIVL